MLKITNKTVKTVDAETTHTEYTVEGTVQLAGDSIWGYSGSDTVAVESINVFDYVDGGKDVNVAHNTTWEIYTDSGFENAISKLLGYDVIFTEQGMQDDEYASMETRY